MNKTDMNNILKSINNTIEDSYKSYDELAYDNNIDISSRGVQVISSEEANSIINELGYDDYEPQTIHLANLSNRETGMGDEKSDLHDYMSTKEDKQ